MQTILNWKSVLNIRDLAQIGILLQLNYPPQMNDELESLNAALFESIKVQITTLDNVFKTSKRPPDTSDWRLVNIIKTQAEAGIQMGYYDPADKNNMIGINNSFFETISDNADWLLMSVENEEYAQKGKSLAPKKTTPAKKAPAKKTSRTKKK